MFLHWGEVGQNVFLEGFEFLIPFLRMLETSICRPCCIVRISTCAFFRSTYQFILGAFSFQFLSDHTLATALQQASSRVASALPYDVLLTIAQYAFEGTFLSFLHSLVTFHLLQWSNAVSAHVECVSPFLSTRSLMRESCRQVFSTSCPFPILWSSLDFRILVWGGTRALPAAVAAELSKPSGSGASELIEEDEDDEDEKHETEEGKFYLVYRWQFLLLTCLTFFFHITKHRDHLALFSWFFEFLCLDVIADLPVPCFFPTPSYLGAVLTSGEFFDVATGRWFPLPSLPEEDEARGRKGAAICK